MKRPLKKELKPFAGDRKRASLFFGVSEKTIIRWLKFYNLYKCKPNYGRKLNDKVANEVRILFSTGNYSIKEIAKLYNVTFSTISRIIKNINYKEDVKDLARVYVVHNIV